MYTCLALCATVCIPLFFNLPLFFLISVNLHFIYLFLAVTLLCIFFYLLVYFSLYHPSVLVYQVLHSKAITPTMRTNLQLYIFTLVVIKTNGWLVYEIHNA